LVIFNLNRNRLKKSCAVWRFPLSTRDRAHLKTRTEIRNWKLDASIHSRRRQRRRLRRRQR